MNLETIIGLEIHAHISTQTKMFCSCTNNSFGTAPNTAVCPICTAQPGALPVPSRAAIEKGARAGLLMGCTVRPVCKFDRKNYFYPDLPSGYQISQFDEPLCEHGAVTIVLPNGDKKSIRVLRLHLENDAGKLTHVGDSSLIDFNRAGSPLMEIVSEPDLRTPEEARAYAEEVQRIVQYADASHADMYRGEMRFDASVSLRPIGDTQLHPRAEIKNLNSFKALEAAITYEIQRQTTLWEAGTPPTTQQTVGWDDTTSTTYLMREKESAADYRYFPEPDIPPLTFTPAWIAERQSELPEQPLARRERFVTQYHLTTEEACTLTSTRALSDYYEQVVAVSGDAKRSAGWVLTELLARLAPGQSIADQPITAAHLGALVQLIVSGDISGKIGKDIFPDMWNTGESPDAIRARKGLKQISDTGALEKIIDTVLVANPESVTAYHAGKKQALGFLVGQIMKATGGQANPQMVNELLGKKLG